MAVGKNKRLSKGKKGGKKKAVDPFSRKDWYEVKAPTIFTTCQVGKTLVTRTTGTKTASDSLKGRVFEVSLADLQQDEDQASRKVRLCVHEVQDRNCLTNFCGMDLTTDKMRSLVKKWQTTIETNVDIKTTDGYTLRLFLIGFTKKRPNQIRTTSYAQSSQVRQIRKRMLDIVNREVGSCDLKEVVHKLISEVIGKQIEKHCSGIYPLQNCMIRKVKVLKAPKFDLAKLMDIHENYSVEVDKPLVRHTGTIL